MFSYSVLMEYVKDVGYTEIGGVYVKKGAVGWKLLTSDIDMAGLIEGVKDGHFLDLYIDHVVDKAIAPANQMQPHVIIRPRTSYFEDLQVKRKYVTIQDLQQQQKNASEEIKKNASEEIKKNALEEENQNKVREMKKQKTCEEINKKAVEKEDKNKAHDEITKIASDNAGGMKKKNASPGAKITHYELKILKRAEENRNELKRRQLMQLANDLTTDAKAKKKGKKIAKKGVSDLEFDSDFERAYVSGHDSLSEDDEEKYNPKPKKIVKQVKRHRTRSAVLNDRQGSTQVTDGGILPPPVLIPPHLLVPPHESLPPPPPLPADLENLTRVANNDGIGTMEAYVLLEKKKEGMKDKQNANDTNNPEPIMQNLAMDDNVLETGESSTKTRKRRGPTKMDSVFTRRLDERPVVELNHELQPISENKKIISELSSFLGTIERLYIPLTSVSWLKVPEDQKNGWWEYVKTKFIIPEEGKEWVLKTIGDAWRVYKSRVKSQYYTKYDNDDDRKANRPKNIPSEQFNVLLEYWGVESVKEKAAQNAANRRNLIDTHTSGRTSFAQIGNELKIKNTAGEIPTKSEIYPNTRKGHKKRAKIAENPETLEDAEEDMVEVDIAAHGPNWLVGRSGRTRKTKNTLPTNVTNKSAELANLREEIVAEMEAKMEAKMNTKLKMILEKLGEMNPTLNVNFEDLCAENSADQDEDEVDGNEAGA